MDAKVPANRLTPASRNDTTIPGDETLGDQVDDEALPSQPPKGKIPNLRLELKQRKGEKGNS
jgi:hypothetical protein